MFPVLLLSLIAAEPAATVTAVQDAPVRITMNNDRRFVRGDRAKVKVRVENDGFLLVLQADAEGRIRVLFPLDPSDDNFVRGDRNYEIRGRGDREAFTVDENSGEGAVYAAVSRDPFRFGDYAINDHWGRPHRRGPAARPGSSLSPATDAHPVRGEKFPSAEFFAANYFPLQTSY
jgi:hypothetical protein